MDYLDVVLVSFFFFDKVALLVDKEIKFFFAEFV